MEAFMLLRDMLGGPPEPIDAFVRDHVAACNVDCTALAAILPSHPKWFSTPESGDEVSYVLVVARPLAESRIRLPAAIQYLGIRITALDPVISFEIDTTEGTVKTNMQEVRALCKLDMAEEERLRIFRSFTGRYVPPVPRTKAVPFDTRTLGTLQPDEYGDFWEAEPVGVPFFDGRFLPVQLMSVSAEDASAIDVAMKNFLRLNAQDRSRAAPAVLENCQNFLSMIDLTTEADHAMAALTDPDAIWPYVDCQSIDIVKDEGDSDGVGEPSIHVVLTCHCEWEPEHGLQIVYRNGERLTRVSEQDGHVRE